MLAECDAEIVNESGHAHDANLEVMVTGRCAEATSSTAPWADVPAQWASG